MIYVTGGAGMIGSHLVDKLVTRKETVVVEDDLSRGSRETLPNGRVGIREINLELGMPDFAPGSTIFHLAAKVTGIEYNRHNHYDMFHSNLNINMNVIEAVRASRPKLLVWVSTACVYPHDAPVPTPEKYGRVCDPEPTNHGYGMAKWVGEQTAIYALQELGIPTVIVRFFNAFGTRDYYDEETSHVAPAIIKRVLDGEDPITVWGTGDQTRVLVDVKDIAKALVLLMDAAMKPEGERRWYAMYSKPHPWIVNIGHDREISIRRLTHEIIALSGREQAEIIYDLSRPDGYPRRAADTTRLRHLIDWVPDTPLPETLAAMIEDYKERYQ